MTLIDPSAPPHPRDATILAAATSHLAGRFPGFHADLLEQSEKNLRSVFARTSAPDIVDVDGVIGQHLHDLVDALDALSIRTLITTFVTEHDAAGTTYEEHEAHVSTSAGRQSILDAYPELSRLRTLLVERRERALDECLESLRAIPHAQRTALGLARVRRIEHSGSDTHRSGRGVLFVDTDGGRVVFKPSASEASDFFLQVREVLDLDGDLLGPLVPEVLARTNAGTWYRLARQSTFDSNSAHVYFRRFGALTALAAALGVTDLHHENVLATRDGPMVVDVETFTSIVPDELPGTAHQELMRSLQHSPLRSMLLPFRFLGASFDLDISALGSGKRGRVLIVRGTRVSGVGTEDIGFEEGDVELAIGHAVSDAIGNRFDPRDHRAALMEGYSRMRAVIAERRRELCAVIARSAPAAVRVVPRPTRVYARFLEASTHPHYLSDTADRRSLLRRLGPCVLPLDSPEQERLLDADVDALIDLDIPYFSATHRGDLMADDGSFLRQIARVRSPMSSMTIHLKRWLERPLAVDLAEIDLALETSTDDVWVAEHRTRRRSARFPARAIPAAEHHVVGSDGRSWLTAVGIGDGLRMAPVTLALYEGGGTMVSAVHQSDRTIAEVMTAVPAAVRHLPSTGLETPALASAFIGAVSEEATLWDLHRAGVEVAPRKLPVAAIPPIARADLAGFDFLGGFGSYLAALARYPSEAIDPPQLRSCMHQFIDAHEDGLLDQRDPGLAHGTAGYISALAAADRLLGGDERLRAVIGRLVLAITPRAGTVLDPGAAHSWCKGYPGMLVALADALRCTDRPDVALESIQQVRRRLRRRRTDVPADISICHGLGGEAIALRSVADALDDTGLHEAAEESFALGRVAIHSGQWRTGLFGAPRHSSFMLGTGGWGAVEAVMAGAVPVLMLGVIR